MLWHNQERSGVDSSSPVFTLWLNSSPPALVSIRGGKGVKGEGRSRDEGGWMGEDEGITLPNPLWQSPLCALSAAAGANTSPGAGLPEATLWPRTPCHCHLSVSQPLHPAIRLEEAHFLPPHSSSLHYPQEGRGKSCWRGLPAKVKRVSLSKFQRWHPATRFSSNEPNKTKLNEDDEHYGGGSLIWAAWHMTVIGEW